MVLAMGSFVTNDTCIKLIGPSLPVGEIVAIRGFMSSLFPIAKEVTARIRAEFPNTPVVWGGIHPTSVPAESIVHTDYLCVGEGELAIIDLCNALDRGEEE